MRPDFPFRPAAFPVFYGWVILGVSTLGIIMSIPGQTMGVSVFTNHLLQATGLSRLEMSNAYLAGTLASGLLLPYGGRLIDRFGARTTVLAACLGLAATLCFLAASDRVTAGLAERAVPPSLAAWSVLAVGFTALRFNGQGMLTMTSRTMVGRWFERRRGLVAGVSGPFVSFAFAGAPLLLSLWIAAAGWRGAWLGMAAAVGLGMAAIGWLFYRDNPEECGLRMDGRAADEPTHAADGSRLAEEPTHDYTRGEALRTTAFWLVTLGIANQAMVGTGITFHIVDLGAEAGLSEASAVSIFLPVAVISTGVGVLAGLSIDRFPVRYLMMVMMLGQCVMFAGSSQLGDPWIRALAIGGWGLSSGFYGPLIVAALPNFFGRAHLGAIQGVHTMVLVVASALGPSVLAAFKSSFGSYRPGLLALCALPAAVFALAPFTRNPQRG